ncbi:hypothetical protein JTE90_000385 [Oedothorax gibbosus]|uniref:Uncharacterized protein n=1 Tax=Oedothorax gibbosus TaxID=931172 RepID=A0AAV6TUV2_9ARAC|nr:hypothetical protein JTE90_000385 [Oedothorax gibbosus]
MKKNNSLQSRVVCPMTSLTEATASPITITFECSVAYPSTIHFFELDMKKNNSLQSSVVCPITSLTEATATSITITFICSVTDPSTIPLLRT